MDSKSSNIGFKVILPYVEIEVIAEDIVRFIITRDVVIDMQKSMEMFEICKKLFPDRAYKSLKVVHHKMRLEQEVMDFLASDVRNGLVSVEAIVVNSSTLKILGNFYLRIKKPTIKTKVFDAEKDAIHWLDSPEANAVSDLYNSNIQYK